MGFKPREPKGRATVAQARAALAHHEALYGIVAPDALRDFYKGGFQKADARYTPAWRAPGVRTPTHFRVLLTPPSWRGIEDATDGWDDARYFVPVFKTSRALFVVADLRSIDAALGWFLADGENSSVDMIGVSLATFVARLGTHPGVHERTSWSWGGPNWTVRY